MPDDEDGLEVGAEGSGTPKQSIATPDPIEEERAARRAAESRADTALRTAETLANAALRTPAPAAPVAPVAEVEMPDPVSRPREFQDWLKRRDEQVRTDSIRAVEPIRVEIQERTRRSDLWGEFKERFPQYAGMNDVVRTAFLMETGGTGALPEDTEDLMRRVSSRIEGMRKQLGGTSDARRAIQRTEGVLGGSRGSDAPGARKAATEGKGKSLTDSFKDWQSTVPFF